MPISRFLKIHRKWPFRAADRMLFLTVQEILKFKVLLLLKKHVKDKGYVRNNKNFRNSSKFENS